MFGEAFDLMSHLFRCTASFLAGFFIPGTILTGYSFLLGCFGFCFVLFIIKLVFKSFS